MTLHFKSKNFTGFSICLGILLLWSVFVTADIGVVLLITLWLIIVAKLSENLYGNIEILGFLIGFFVFLIGGQVAITYLDYDGYDRTFPQWIENHTNFILILSMLSLILGYAIAKSIHKGSVIYTVINVKVSQSSDYYQQVRKISRIAFFVSMGCAMLMLLEKILFFRVSGDYYATYSEYKSHLPYIIKTFDNFMPYSFYVFLGTRPRKKEAILPILMYLVYLAGSLFTGRRIFIVVGLMAVLTYFIINDHETDEKWITKRLIRIACIVAPVFIIFLTVYGEIRINESKHDYNILHLFGKFIGSQGFTVNVLKYERLNGSSLGTGKFYSFYNTMRFLRTSPLTRWFMPSYNFTYGEYSVQNALNGNSFANTVTYLNSPLTFLKGGGYGSSYIAELFRDFGYLGIILGNILYGFAFGTLSRVRRKGILFFALSFIFLECMFKVPRYNFDYFVAEFSIVFNWVYLFGIFFVAKYLHFGTKKE